jgi:hypothetical protein
MKQKIFKALTLSIALVLALIFPNKAFALTLTPIRYEISGNPGETITEEMTLVNESDEAQTYYVSFSNFEAQGDTGSPAFIDNPTEDVGTWMSTAQSSINIAAGEQKKVSFKIEIPKNAEPGGHFGAIFWGTTATRATDGVSIGTKTGMLVLLTVNGEVSESAGLVDFQTNDKKFFYKALPVGFQYRFSNQGGDRVKPVGNIIVRSILGWRVKKVNANPFDGNVLPRTTRKFSPEWSKGQSVEERAQEVAQKEKYSFTKELKREWNNFALGIFRAKLHAVYGANNQEVSSKAVYFIVFPIELILVSLLIIIPGFLIFRALIRRYNRSIIRRAQMHYKNQQGA